MSEWLLWRLESVALYCVEVPPLPKSTHPKKLQVFPNPTAGNPIFISVKQKMVFKQQQQQQYLVHIPPLVILPTPGPLRCGKPVLIFLFSSANISSGSEFQ